jgi:MFS transporter, PPP family, 3-phenylpropionic acid transporter
VYSKPQYHRPVTALRLLVLFLGAALGVLYPFIPVILAERGFSPAQIGLVASIGAVGFTLAAPWWGHLADVRLGRSRALQVSAIGGAAAAGALLGAWPPIVIAVLFMAYWIFESAWQPLADALTVNHVDRRGYARVRAMTSLAFALGTIGAGFAYDVTGYQLAFVLTIVLALGMALAAGFVPDIRRAELRGRAAVGDDAHGGRFGSAGLAFRVAPRLAGVLAAVMILHVAIISGFTFLPLRLGDLGSPPSDVALSAGVSALSEIPAMLVAAAVAARIGLRGMFVGSALIYAGATASWTVLETPSLIIATRAFTGVAFAWVVVGVVLTIARLLPRELQGTGQSLYQTVGFGIAAIIANIVGGLLYDAIGSAAVFGTGTVLSLGAAALGWWVFPPERVLSERHPVEVTA